MLWVSGKPLSTSGNKREPGPVPAASTENSRMRCLHCKSLEAKVVDSRQAEDGASIRRRRECLSCGGRFTTFERAEPAGLRVLKRSGEPEAYDRAKVVGGVMKACKNRPVSEADIELLADEVE